jgi:hypothetical protein
MLKLGVLLITWSHLLLLLERSFRLGRGRSNISCDTRAHTFSGICSSRLGSVWNSSVWFLYSNFLSVSCGRLGGVMVSVIAIASKVRGFNPGIKPGLGDGFLRAIKILSTPSFRLEAKPSTHVVRFHGIQKSASCMKKCISKAKSIISFAMFLRFLALCHRIKLWAG